jgi:hypothetical protein
MTLILEVYLLVQTQQKLNRNIGLGISKKIEFIGGY